ncbi:MAG: lipoprotein [Castellaniella sp.]|nr:lipoprotein [Castellaniella sp.]
MKKLFMVALAAVFLAGCNDADIASRNLSTAADNFEINRRVIFYNGITGEYMLSIEGLCALGNQESGSRQRTVTCKTGPGQYKKHFLGLSDNVTFFAEQIEPAPANTYHYRVIFKPQTILPDVDFRGSANAIQRAVTPDSRD